MPVHVPLRSVSIQLAAAGIVVLVLGLFGWTLWDGREAARREAITAASNIVIGLERDVARTFENLDSDLQGAVRASMLPGLETLSPELRNAVLFDTSTEPSVYGGVAITDASGLVQFQSGEAPTKPITIADREYFKSHRDHDDLGLVISRPLLSRGNGEWSLALSRRLNHPDGSFAGVALGTVRLSYLRQLFRQLNLDQTSVVSLFSTDGILFSRRPFRESDIGRDVSASGLYQALLNGRSGVYEGDSVVDGVRRLYVYRQVGTLPLITTVGLSVNVLYADWRQKAMIITALLAVLSAVSAALAWALRKEFIRRARAEEEARHSEQELAASAARLDAWFRNSPDGMIIVSVAPDRTCTYEAVSPSFLASLGMTEGQLVGKTPEECFPSAMGQAILERWRECITRERPIQYSFPVVLLPKTMDLDVYLTPVFDGDGRVCRLIGGMRDVTTRNKVEQQLRQSQKMESLGQLTAGVAHDFNNLLQAILSATDLLQDIVSENAAAMQCVDLSRKAARRGASLTHRLLTISRQQELDPALLDLHMVLGEAGELFNHVLGPHIQIETEVEPGLWPVIADPCQVESCLMNLAVNARDAMPSGGTLRIALLNRTTDREAPVSLEAGDYVVLRVTDSGVGMDADTLARCCDPFYTTKGPGKGSGLGLAMASGFAGQSGGALAIRSERNHGTEVEVWLPRASAAYVLATPKTIDIQRGEERILLVDDDDEVRTVLVMVLEAAGYDVIDAPNGPAAIDIVASDRPLDLIVTDYAMPGMTGAELLAKVGRIRPDLPAVIITGYDATGGSDVPIPESVRVLHKPLRREDLLAGVRSAIDEPTGRPAQVPGNASEAEAGPNAGAGGNANVVHFELKSRQRANSRLEKSIDGPS